MENCLKQSLKHSIENDLLCKLGELRIDFISSNDPSELRVSCTLSKKGEARTVNGTFTDGSYEKELSSTTNLKISQEGTSVFIKEKYNIVDLYDPDTWSVKNIKFCINELKYCENLNRIGGKANVGIYGNIETFDGKNIQRFETGVTDGITGNINISLPNIRILRVLSKNIKGSINNCFLNNNNVITSLNFANCSSLTGTISTLNIPNTMISLNLSNIPGINGTVEDFCELNKNSNARSLSLILYGTSVTYNGMPIPNNKSYNVVFDGEGGYTIS